MISNIWHLTYLFIQINFPPNIFYKIFTYRPITDVCASSPKDYNKQGLMKPVALNTNKGPRVTKEDRSGWYQRMENNTWRLFCNKVPKQEDFCSARIEFCHSFWRSELNSSGKLKSSQCFQPSNKPLKADVMQVCVYVLLLSQISWMCEPAEIGGDKKMDFHYSKLQRKRDLERWRKRKKIEWLKQM